MDFACDSTLRLITDQLRGLPEGGWTPEKVAEAVNEDVWPTVWNQTEIGRTFKSRYAYTDELRNKFEAAFIERFGVAGQMKTDSQGQVLPWPGLHTAERCVAILNDLMLSRDPSLTPLEDPAEPVKPAAPTAAQAFESLCNVVRRDVGDLFGGEPGISSLEIEQKKNASSEYRRAFEYVMQSSVAAGYGKTLEPSAKPKAPPEIERFAHLLNQELQTRGGFPKPAAGYFTLHAGGKEYKYSVSDFQRMSDEAIKFELVR